MARAPMRAATRVLRALVYGIAIASGRMHAPVSSGEEPLTSCRYWALM